MEKESKNKIYYEEDAIGKHKVIEKPNGIKIRILQEPSPEYTKKLQERKVKDKDKMEKENKKNAEEKLIRDEMRNIAIDKLKKEGKL